jgi:serine/threonine-protein kinase
VQASANTDEQLIGFVLAGKYRVMRQIGRGGMGVVYEAEHIELGKKVAIKLMLDKYEHDGEATARFRREALAASRIGNPHIIDVSDFGTAPNGRPFVVMELLSGLPLSKVIEMTGPLPPWRAIQIMKQVLRAVGAAHAKGIIHRDLKPDNIFIVNQGDDQHDFVKLLDFGISKVIDPDEQVAFTKLTSTGVVMGTPLYMAPEQAMGQAIERFADIYACGVILFEMLAGRPPFEGQTYAVLVAKLLTQQAPLLSDVRPGTPNALVGIVHKALEKEPKDRWQTAEQFLLALPGEKTPSLIELAGTLDSSSGAVAISPPTTIKRVPRKWPLYALLALGVAAAGVITLVVMQNKSEPAKPQVAAQTPSGSAPSLSVTAPAGSAVVAAPAVGFLQIKSVPPGATVFVDGNERGKTPIEITLEPRRYKVRVELAGHQTIESEEDVREKERASVVLQLLKEAPVAKDDRKPRDKTRSSAISSTKKAEPPKDAAQPQQPYTDDSEPKTDKKPDQKTIKKGPGKPNPY